MSLTGNIHTWIRKDQHCENNCWTFRKQKLILRPDAFKPLCCASQLWPQALESKTFRNDCWRMCDVSTDLLLGDFIWWLVKASGTRPIISFVIQFRTNLEEQKRGRLHLPSADNCIWNSDDGCLAIIRTVVLFSSVWSTITDDTVFVTFLYETFFRWSVLVLERWFMSWCDVVDDINGSKVVLCGKSCTSSFCTGVSYVHTAIHLFLICSAICTDRAAHPSTTTTNIRVTVTCFIAGEHLSTSVIWLLTPTKNIYSTQLKDISLKICRHLLNITAAIQPV